MPVNGSPAYLQFIVDKKTDLLIDGGVIAAIRTGQYRLHR